MDAERMNQVPRNESWNNEDYPPFDPGKAKKLYEQDKARGNQSSPKSSDESEISYDHSLYSNLSEYLAAQEASKIRTSFDNYGRRPTIPHKIGRSQRRERIETTDSHSREKSETASGEMFDGRNGETFRQYEQFDLKQQMILLMAVDDIYTDPDSDFSLIKAAGNVSNATTAVLDEITKTGEPIISVFNKLAPILDDYSDGVENYGVSDLSDTFIDMSSTFIMNKMGEAGIGSAYGLMNKMNMTLEQNDFICDSNYKDKIQLDKMFVEPMINEYLNDKERDNSSTGLYDYLDNKLMVEEANMRVAKRRGENPGRDAERRIQAIRSSMEMLKELLDNYDRNMAYINNNKDVYK